MLMIKQRVYLASIEAQSSWPVGNHFCDVGMEKNRQKREVSTSENGIRTRSLWYYSGRLFSISFKTCRSNLPSTSCNYYRN